MSKAGEPKARHTGVSGRVLTRWMMKFLQRIHSINLSCIKNHLLEVTP